MKIYGDYSFLIEKLNVIYDSRVQIVQNNTKIVEFADSFIEGQKAASQDQAVISKEGMDYIREQLSDLSSGMSPEIEDGKTLTQLTGPNMSLMDGLCKTYITLRLDSIDKDGISRNLHMEMEFQYRQELDGRNKEDWDSHAESLVNAYASAYKKIIEGYAGGNGEVWVEDTSTGEEFSGVELEIDGQPVRYRRLTKEECLKNLDQTFDKLVREKAEEFAKEAKAKELADAKAEEKKESDSEKALRAFEKMINGLVDEVRALLDRVMQKLNALLGAEEKDIDFEGRMEIEAHNHRMETVTRGKQQSQYANYRKISQMASDMQTLLGNVRA